MDIYTTSYNRLRLHTLALAVDQTLEPVDHRALVGGQVRLATLRQEVVALLLVLELAGEGRRRDLDLAARVAARINLRGFHQFFRIIVIKLLYEIKEFL
jgi:hypothetical protein